MARAAKTRSTQPRATRTGPAMTGPAETRPTGTRPTGTGPAETPEWPTAQVGASTSFGGTRSVIRDAVGGTGECWAGDDSGRGVKANTISILRSDRASREGKRGQFDNSIKVYVVHRLWARETRSLLGIFW